MTNDIEPKTREVQTHLPTKPKGWSRRSNAPYYKELYGEQMKREADIMLSNRQDMVYRYDVWCTAKTGMSTSTLYNRINQSIRFLCEYLDPDGRYKKWYAMVDVNRVSGLGVRISFIPEFRDSDISNFSGIPTTTREATPKWRLDMDYWLENSTEPVFVADNLCLSDDEVRALKIELGGLDGIGKNIRPTCIKLARLC